MTLTVGAAALVAVAYVSADQLGLGRPTVEMPLLVPVRLQDLDVTVTERGSLESVVTVDGICELQGQQVKIMFLTPEGNHVEKGEIVCKFDPTEVDKNIAQQQIKVKQAEGKVSTSKQDIEIQRNDGESKVSEAKVELKLAELNLEKYQKGDYKAELADAEGILSQNQQKQTEANNKLDQYRDLVKKGFRSLEQLRALEQELSQYEFMVTRDKLKLQIKKQFDYQLKTVELQSKVDQARSKIERTQATLEAQLAKATGEYEAAGSTAKLEQQQLDEFLEQKQKTEIKAEQAGVVAYANEPWYDSSRQIREGAMVYNRQKIFSLPDMSNMQVVVNIHESLVKKVKPDQTAEIRIESFPNLRLVGKVKSVAQLADSNRMWDNGGAKVYKTVVMIEKMPEEELRPSMTAEVKIQVRTLSNVLVVPIQAVAERRGQHFSYVAGPRGGLERREVAVGDTNEKLVQVLSGLNEGELVALDARKRLDAEAKSAGEKGEDSESGEEGPSAPESPASVTAPEVASVEPAPTATPAPTAAQ